MKSEERSEAGGPRLSLVKEEKICSLLNDAEAIDDYFEASGVVFRDGFFYIVFDNLSQIVRVSRELNIDHGQLLGPRIHGCGYEGITFNEREEVYYTVIECRKTGKGSFHAWVHEYDKGFCLRGEARLDFEFSKKNKGFEGITCVQRADGAYLLALCEGNKCKGGGKGRKVGGGRIQVFKKERDAWHLVTVIKLPKTVLFEDFSGLDVSKDGKVAVVSQRSSKLWVGTLDEVEWRFAGDGEVYLFPRAKNDKRRYGNIEGVSWITSNQVVVVSDARKKDDPKKYEDKEQSIHIFRIFGQPS